jgi:hypothetical protein
VRNDVGTGNPGFSLDDLCQPFCFFLIHPVFSFRGAGLIGPTVVIADEKKLRAVERTTNGGILIFPSSVSCYNRGQRYVIRRRETLPHTQAKEMVCVC